ncbi:MAG: PEP-CTERM sorting domain-containing protein [Terriglobales bacterium]
MRRIAVVLAFSALLIPMAAWASGINITNTGGSVTFSASGIASTGSELKSWNNIVPGKGHSLGTVSFGTGAWTSGGIWTGGTLSATNSYFDVIGVGQWAKKLTGQTKNPITLFAGGFVGPIDWTVDSHTGDKYICTLSGNIEGTLYTGRTVTGTTSQNIWVFTDQEPQDHKGSLHMGNGHFNTPEPGTLGLLGVGLMLIAGTVRGKILGA